MFFEFLSFSGLALACWLWPAGSELPLGWSGLALAWLWAALAWLWPGSGLWAALGSWAALGWFWAVLGCSGLAVGCGAT